MADTSYVVNDPLTVKLWSKYLMAEVLKNTWAMNFAGTGADNLIQIKTETQKGPGDKITFALRMQMSGAGIAGDNTLEGSEEALTTYTDALYVDQLRHAHRSNGRMSQQRVSYDMREEGRTALADWWSGRIDESWINQIAGNTVQADTRYTGMQATVAPDAAHVKRVNSNEATDDASISTTSTFSLTIIDKAVEAARVLSPAIRPLRIGGKPMYAVFMHDYQVTDMRTNTSTGQWLDIQKSVIQGGETSDNPIFNGALGVYNGTILHSDTRMPLAIANAGTVVASTRRAVFCGAQAAVMGFGQDNGPSRMTWDEKTFDYGNKLGVSCGMIWGVKKSIFNSLDYGTIVLATYAAAH